MRRMCCCTRIHARGEGERSISLPSTKGPRGFYRVLKGVVAATAVVVASGTMAKLVVSEKGTTKSFGPLLPRPTSTNVLLLSYVAHTKREAIFLICFASLSGLSTPHPPPVTTTTATITCQTSAHSHARLSTRVRVLRSVCTRISILYIYIKLYYTHMYTYVYNIYLPTL